MYWMYIIKYLTFIFYGTVKQLCGFCPSLHTIFRWRSADLSFLGFKIGSDMASSSVKPNLHRKRGWKQRFSMHHSQGDSINSALLATWLLVVSQPASTHSTTH